MTINHSAIMHCQLAYHIWHTLLQEYNEGYYLNVLAESLPSLILTFVNQVYYKHFTVISIISLTFASLQLTNAVWKFT